MAVEAGQTLLGFSHPKNIRRTSGLFMRTTNAGVCWVWRFFRRAFVSVRSHSQCCYALQTTWGICNNRPGFPACSSIFYYEFFFVLCNCRFSFVAANCAKRKRWPRFRNRYVLATVGPRMWNAVSPATVKKKSYRSGHNQQLGYV